MGKRKSSKKPVARKQNEPLSTTFKCLFCHHEKSVTVKVDKQSMFGNLSCKVCGQKFQTPINNLSVAVDVYCDWVDACEEARLKAPKKASKPVSASSAPASASAPVSRRSRSNSRSASPERKSSSKRERSRDAYDDEDDDDEDYDRHRRRVPRDYDDDDE